MQTTDPPTYRALLDQFQVQYDNAINSGEISPFLYPQNTFNVGVLILYLLIPPNRPRLRQYARYPALALITYFSLTTIRDCRSMFCALGFGVGLLTACGLLWSATMILFFDAPLDFKRVERKQEGIDQDTAQQDKADKHINGHVASGIERDNGMLSNRHVLNTDSHEHTQNEANSKANTTKKSTPTTKPPISFEWQSYPLTPFSTRLSWILDLLTNPRGLGWNWRLSSLPTPPYHIQAQLQELQQPPTTGPSKATLRPLLTQNLRNLLISYLALDILKVLMMADPYFWGLPNAPPPTHLPTLIQTTPTFLKSYRLTLSLLGIHSALVQIFSLGPLLFAGILGPRILGVRAEPWMYASSFGGFSNVFDKGLKGWWGGWWHQMFRVAFTAPSRWAIEKLGLEKKAASTKALELFIAFGLSGFLHACGSYTQLPHTRPLRGPFLFFILQPLGIITQEVFCKALRRVGVLDRVPKRLRQAVNFVYVHVWGYFTAPLLTDDFAKGGVWLFEPVPVSLVRGLGFGAKGEGWWCWGGRLVRWYSGDTWWKSGFAI